MYLTAVLEITKKYVKVDSKHFSNKLSIQEEKTT